MARDCLMQADLIEILSRLKREYQYADSDVRVNLALDINHRMTESGETIPIYGTQSARGDTEPKIDERILGLYEAFHTTLAYNLRQQAREAASMTDYALLDSIFKTELSRVGLHPKHVIVMAGDSVPDIPTRGMWRIDYRLLKDSPVIYKAYISPPLGSILRQSAGVAITIGLIIIVLTFAFVYLIRTVMNMRSIEEMKDDFTNNMTHELKTPIAASYSAIDTLINHGKHNDPEKRERYLRMALTQLTQLSERVEAILAMSLERRKTMTLQREKIVLRPLLDDLVRINSLRAGKAVEFAIEVSPEVLEVTIDPTHFTNVINNLIDNAIKYSGDNVTIKITADQRGMTVSDNGIGIPAKALPLIFNKFYRVSTGNRHEIRGYGIGLYYVRSIVERMGWQITVKSTPGKGSAFHINFNTPNGGR